MNLLLTGASGFVGKNIKPILANHFNITTLGLSKSNYIQHDLTKPNLPTLNSFDLVVHAAGKAHTNPKNLKDKEEFFKINYTGTKNLCNSFDKNNLPKSFVYISSVSVYGVDSGNSISESYPLNGKTSYAKSKIRTEEFLKNWCKDNQVKLLIVRPSLIVGPNPPGNLNTMINAIKSKKYLIIGSGDAMKSLIHVNDIASFIICSEGKEGIYNLCDSEPLTFFQITQLICKQLNVSLPYSVPYAFAKFLAIVGDFLNEGFPLNSFKFDKITKNLTFSNKKALRDFDWHPISVKKNFSIK